MATPTADDLKAEADEHEATIEQLRALRTQAGAVQPPPFAQINRTYATTWRQHQNKLISDIDKRISEAASARKQVATKIEKLNPTAKPLTEAGQLAENERRRKEALEQQTQKPQAELAKNRLEQQKAADAESSVGLGVGGQSLKDLLTSSKITKDADGNYVFSQDNTGAKLTPVQAAKAAQLKAGIAGQAGATAEQLFGSGIAPKFDKNGNSIFDAAGNPFIGTKDQYNALGKLYRDSQPAASVDLVVPSTTLDRVYKTTAPAYGDTFPGNPVEQDAKTPAAKALVAGYGADPAKALSEGRQIATNDALGRPISLDFSKANPLVPAEGPVVAAPALSGITQIQAQPPAPVGEQAAAKILRLARETNLDPEKVKSIFAASADPEVQRRAIEQERADAASAVLPGQLAEIGKTAYGYGTLPGLYVKGVQALSDMTPSLDTQAKKLEEQRRLDAAARAARGLDPLEDESTLPSYPGS